MLEKISKKFKILILGLIIISIFINLFACQNKQIKKDENILSSNKTEFNNDKNISSSNEIEFNNDKNILSSNEIKINNDENILSSDETNFNNDETLLELLNVKNTMNREIKVGDIVKYGVMAHDDYQKSDFKDIFVSPMMDWKVLDVIGEKAFLISDKIIMACEHSKINDYISTEYDYIFSDFEREGIIKDEFRDEKIFIPTKQIYKKYFGEMDVKGMNEKAVSIASRGAKSVGLDVSKNKDFEYFGAGTYWIYDELDKNKIMWVGEYGHLYEEIENVNEIHGIRLCMYVDINHLVYEKQIYFGEYEQDNILTNGKEPIEWKLLELNNGKMILTSKNILFCSIFDTKTDKRDYFYESSVIRKKLNKNFYNKAFNGLEQTLLSEHNFIVKKDINGEDEEAKELNDKVYIMNSEEFNRYYKANEKYAPPENLRFDTKITSYAMSSNEEGYYPDELYSTMTYYNGIYYWTREISFGVVYGEYQVVGTAKNGKNEIIRPRLTYSYGVRPCIEIDINNLLKIIEKNSDRIKKLEKISSSSEVFKKNLNETHINIDSSNDYTLGMKYLNTLSSINNLLKEKYNLNLDSNYYDLNNEKTQITVKVYSSETKYKSLMTFKYKTDEEGFTTNEKLIYQNDICDINGVNLNNDNNKITLRNYELVILRLFNQKTIPSYEILPIKKALIDNVNSKLNEIVKDDYLYAVKSNVIDNGQYPDTYFGYRNVEPIDGDNDFLIDVVYNDKISRYDVKINIKYLDDKSYFINDINIEFVKKFNVPGDFKKTTEFLETEIYDDILNLEKIYQNKITNDTKQKKITTYDELVDKTLNKKDNNTNDLDCLTPVKKGQNILDEYYNEFYPDKISFDIKEFGEYKNKKIEWYILANENDQKLLISKYIIDNKSFSDKNMCFSWEDSSIREWLNNQFYDEAFNIIEKFKIKEVNLDYKNSSENVYYSKDKVFLLSREEFKKFFGGLSNASINSYGIAYPTNFAKNVDNNGQKLFVETKPDRYDEYSLGCSNYWLRDFSNGIYVQNVTPIGQILSETFFNNNKAGVRPCILINDKTSENEKNEMSLDNTNDEEVDIIKYEYLTTLKNKDLYMDINTNIFTFENGEKIIFGKTDNSFYKRELSELKEYCFKDVYIDKENEKIYFIDWSEKYIEGLYSGNYNSLVEINKDLTKTKIAEKVYDYVCLKDQIIYSFEIRNDVYAYKDSKEKKLNIGEHHYFVLGKNGDDFCFVKERTFNTNNIYKIEGDSITKVNKIPN